MSLSATGFAGVIDYDEQAAAEQGYAFFFRLMHHDDIAFVLGYKYQIP